MNTVKTLSNFSTPDQFVKIVYRNRSLFFNLNSFDIIDGGMAEIKFAFDVKNNTIFINAFHNILVDSHSKAYKKITGILEFILDQAIHKKCDTQVEAIEQVLYCPKCDDVVKESDLK